MTSECVEFLAPCASSVYFLLNGCFGSCSGSPLEILKQLESTEVPETYSGEFECVVSREDAEGSWFFGDKLLTPSSKYIISSRRGRHTLSVKDVKKEDQGKYTFTVGEFKTSASLKMKRESLKS